ncbi:hypothetical protein E2542_SST10330 [Spatholobus suberectus]|nr:hypothetical protein E2542_SST10330 [Spatholobus suberectus]
MVSQKSTTLVVSIANSDTKEQIQVTPGLDNQMANLKIWKFQVLIPFSIIDKIYIFVIHDIIVVEWNFEARDRGIFLILSASIFVIAFLAAAHLIITGEDQLHYTAFLGHFLCLLIDHLGNNSLRGTVDSNPHFNRLVDVATVVVDRGDDERGGMAVVEGHVADKGPHGLELVGTGVNLHNFFVLEREAWRHQLLERIRTH